MIESFVDQSLQTYHVPGASLVVLKDDQVISEKSWGKSSDGQAITADSEFLIGSVSKPLTALGVLLLVQDGTLALDTPIDIYVPDFHYSSPDTTKITVRQLLDQTSGISPVDGLDVTDRSYSADDGITQAVQRLSGTQLIATPGKAYRYTSANYLLLGSIIQSVSGMSYEAFMTSRVFTPLGMTRTTASQAAATKAGLHRGYESWGGYPLASSALFYDNSGAPYGYISSTAHDLAKFLEFMLRGGTILKPEYLKLLHTPPADGRTYTMGWHYNRDEALFYHGGATPQYRSEVYYDLDKQTAAVLLTNKYNATEDSQVSTVMSGIRTLLDGAQPTTPTRPIPTTQLLIVAVEFLLVIGLGALIRYRQKVAKRSRLLLVASAALSAAIAAGLLPLLLWAMGTPWHSLWLFAKDIAVLTLVSVVLIACYALFFVWQLLARRSH